MINKMRILVVDDEKMCRNIIAKILRRNNYEVVTASNGREALEYFKRECLDLIITDIEMPGMTGIELVKRIRTIDRDIGVIIITGNLMVDSYRRSSPFDIVEYLIKPIKINELIKTVEKVLSPHENRVMAVVG